MRVKAGSLDFIGKILILKSYFVAVGLRVGNLAVELAQSYESAGGVSPRNLNEIKCLRLIRWLLAWLQSPDATHCTVAANNIARSGGRGRELAFRDN